VPPIEEKSGLGKQGANGIAEMVPVLLVSLKNRRKPWGDEGGRFFKVRKSGQANPQILGPERK